MNVGEESSLAVWDGVDTKGWEEEVALVSLQAGSRRGGQRALPEQGTITDSGESTIKAKQPPASVYLHSVLAITNTASSSTTDLFTFYTFRQTRSPFRSTPVFCTESHESWFYWSASATALRWWCARKQPERKLSWRLEQYGPYTADASGWE